MRFLNGMVLVVAIALLGACAARTPIEEVRAFKSAYSSFSGASQTLFDNLAVAERALGKRRAESQAKNRGSGGDAQKDPCANVIHRIVNRPNKIGFIQGFCVKDSRYFTVTGDPPATGLFRQGVVIVGQYADVLLLLAEGRNIAEVKAQVAAIAQNVASVASIAASVVGTPGAGAVVKAGLPKVIAGLLPILEVAAKASNRREVKRLVLEGAPQVKNLIGAMRNASPAIFNVLASGPRRIATRQGRQNKTIAEQQVKLIESYRVGVATYVVLLDGLEATFEKLVVAHERPRNPVTLSELAARSAELKAQAEAWRVFFGTLNSSGTQ